MPKDEENEDPITALARELRWKMEQLDPSDERDWEDMNDRERSFFVLCVEHLLRQEELPAAQGAAAGDRPRLDIPAPQTDRTGEG